MEALVGVLIARFHGIELLALLVMEAAYYIVFPEDINSAYQVGRHVPAPVLADGIANFVGQLYSVLVDIKQPAVRGDEEYVKVVREVPKVADALINKVSVIDKENHGKPAAAPMLIYIGISRQGEVKVQCAPEH